MNYLGQSHSQAPPASQYNHQQQYYSQQHQQPFPQHHQHHIPIHQMYQQTQAQISRSSVSNHDVPVLVPAQHAPPQHTHTQQHSHQSQYYQQRQQYHHNHPPSTNYDYAQMQAAREQDAQRLAIESSRRRARKPTDKNMPDGIEDCIVGDGVQTYKRLRDMERRMDATIMRKKLNLETSHDNSVGRTRTLRVWISNTVEEQPWQADGLNDNTFDFTDTDASYRVKIEGRLLPDELDDEPINVDSDDDDIEQDSHAMVEDTTISKQSQTTEMMNTYRFTHFIKSMTVDYPKSHMKDENVEWKKSASAANAQPLDQLIFKRGGDENMNITINLTLDERIERYALSQDLVDIMDQTVATRAEAVNGIWEYIKLHELQEDEEKRSFRCDEPLRKIFGRYTELLPHVPERIMKHLDPLPPVKLPYTIRTDQKFHDDPKPTIYDILVTVADPLSAQLRGLKSSPPLASSLTEISALNEQIALMIQNIGESKAKHTFLTALAKDPQHFINQWMSSQTRDLEVIMGEAARGGAEDATSEEFRKGGKDGVWGSQQVKETINLMLASNKGRV